jgi:hypothetical protein
MTMFTALWQNPLARWRGGLRRGAYARRGRGRFVPAVEALEGRRLLAQILFGGDVLKETFDDLPATAITDNKLDDPGYLDGVPVGTAVFHHDFGLAQGLLLPGGDTAPPSQPPGQTAQDIVIRNPPFLGAEDVLTIHPYLPPGAGTAEVHLVTLDVKSGSDTAPARIYVHSQTGFELVTGGRTNLATVTASSDDVIGKDAAGNDIKLGPITHLVMIDTIEIDNVQAVVFFPGISTPPVAKDDVCELFPDAQPGQTFNSYSLSRSSDPYGSVLDNDSLSGSGLHLAMRRRDPAHGFLSWSPNDDGTFSYTPDSTFQGTDSFTYVAQDANGFSNEATVTIVTADSPLDSDGDGVPDDVEAWVPPGKGAVYGDGNNDGTPDYLQPKVASALDSGFQYTTLVASDGAFQDVSINPVPASPPLPGGVGLTSGLYKFQLAGLAANAPAVVTLTPASGTALASANAFYVLDPGSGAWSRSDATVTGADVTLHLPGSASGVVALQGGPASVQLTAYPGQAHFVHHEGDFGTPPLTGRVDFVAPPGEAVTVVKVPSSDEGGTVDLQPDGTFVWHGSAQTGSFAFRVTDASGTATSGIATETILIDDDLPPLVVADDTDFYVFSPEGQGSSFDPSGDLLGVGSMSPVERGLFQYVYLGQKDPAHQALHFGFENLKVLIVNQPIRAFRFQVNADGTFRYLPLLGFRGVDEFSFKVNDGYRDSNVATLHIRVFHDLHDLQPQGLNFAQIQVPVSVPSETRMEAVGLEDPAIGSQITDFQPVANPSPTGDFPPGTSAADFPIGFFQFTVVWDPHGPATAEVHLSLPADATAPTHYYKYGPTPDDLTPHWYDFTFDNDPASPDFQTGAVFPGQTDPVTGEVVPAGKIYLHLRAGRRGDSNLLGGPVSIVDPGGPGLFAPAASVTGPATGTPGQPVTFALSAADPSSAALAAGFTYTIDWGDGSPVQTVAASPGNGAGVAAGHVFTRAGSFTVQVFATDASGLASTLATATIAVTAPPPPAAAPPSISSLSPAFAAANRRHLTLTVSGLNFTPASVVTFNGRPLQTTFVSDTRLVVANVLDQVRPLLRHGRRRVPGRARGKGLVAVVDPVGGASAPVLFAIR